MPPIEPSEKDFATLLKDYRKAAQMTQVQLGALIGFDGTYIGKVEKSARYPTGADTATKEDYEQHLKDFADYLESKRLMTRPEREIFFQAWERGGERWLLAHPSKRWGQPQKPDEAPSEQETTGGGLNSAQTEDTTTPTTTSTTSLRFRWLAPISTTARIAMAAALILVLVASWVALSGRWPTTTSTPAPSGSWYIKNTGPCKWLVFTEASGLRPGSRVQVYDRNFIAFDCTTGASSQGSWGPTDWQTVDPYGNWGPWGWTHTDYGSYHYEIHDDAGHVVRLDIAYNKKGIPIHSATPSVPVARSPCSLGTCPLRDAPTDPSASRSLVGLPIV